jgi:hypothetical protein
VLTDTVAGADDAGTEVADKDVVSTAAGSVVARTEEGGAAVGAGDDWGATDGAASPSSPVAHAASVANPSRTTNCFIRRV